MKILLVKSKTQKVIRLLFKYSENKTLTISLWKEAASKSGIKNHEFDGFADEFIFNKNFKTNIINHIKNNS